jgi:lysozyme
MFTSLVSMLKRHEGFRGKPYHCTAGKLTIGYGRNLDDVGITEVEAEFLLKVDTLRATDSAGDIFPGILSYTENRQIAIINMIFNLGKTRFKGFRKMIDAINRDDWESAADEAMDSRWYGQVGVRAHELVNLLREG